MKEDEYLRVIKELQVATLRRNSGNNCSAPNLVQPPHINGEKVSKRIHSNSYSHTTLPKSPSTDGGDFSELTSASTEWIHVAGLDE